MPRVTTILRWLYCVRVLGIIMMIAGLPGGLTLTSLLAYLGALPETIHKSIGFTLGSFYVGVFLYIGAKWGKKKVLQRGDIRFPTVNLQDPPRPAFEEGPDQPGVPVDPPEERDPNFPQQRLRIVPEARSRRYQETAM